MTRLRGTIARAKLLRNALILGIIVVMALLWQQVFTMTGVSRWQQPPGIERPAPPEPITIEPLPTGWVDLKRYQESHPVWQP